MEGIPFPAELKSLYSFHAGDDIEIFQLARVADVITARTSVTNIVEKTGRAGPLTFLSLHTEWANQRGERLCVSELHTVWMQAKPDNSKIEAHPLLEPEPVPQPPAPPLSRLAFEDMAIGKELPALVRRVTPPVIMRWCAAAEIFRRDHFDYTYATKAAGLPDVIGSAWWTFACLWSYLSHVAGRDGWTWKMSQQVRGNMLMGDTLTATGKVVAMERRDGYGLVDVDLTVKNQDGVTVIPGKATLALPLRGGKPIPYPFQPS